LRDDGGNGGYGGGAVVRNVFGENIPGEFIRKHCGEARGRGR